MTNCNQAALSEPGFSMTVITHGTADENNRMIMLKIW